MEGAGEAEVGAGTSSEFPQTAATGNEEGPTPSPAPALSAAPDLTMWVNPAGHTGALRYSDLNTVLRTTRGPTLYRQLTSASEVPTVVKVGKSDSVQMR